MGKIQLTKISKQACKGHQKMQLAEKDWSRSSCPPPPQTSSPQLAPWHSSLAMREAPFNFMPPLFGHCPFGGGVSTLARMVWALSYGRIWLILESLNPCQDGLGHLFRDEVPFWVRGACDNFIGTSFKPRQFIAQPDNLFRHLCQ